MASSGSKDFSITRTDVVNSALRKVGAYDSGETADASDGADAVLALNLLVKEWAVRGIDVPWRETVTLFLQPGTQSYTIGPSGTGHATRAYVETSLAANAAISATTLSLTSAVGIAASDFIGIRLDDGMIHWTTVVNPATTTITDGLASAATAGNRVYAYTAKATRPQKLVYVHRRDASGHDTEVDLIGDIEYRRLSNKGSSGPVNQVFYQPTRTNGTLYVWPVDGGVDNDKLILISQPPVDDFDAPSNEPEFPIEWGMALIYGLAKVLAPEYPVDLKDRIMLSREADEYLDAVLAHDVENASVIFAVDKR